jgi:hypothetical protein
MPLARISLANYRCFAQPVDVELRPLTLILGRNNSGKSALVRAPVVCDTGIHTESAAPLDLDQLSEEMLESFTDLIYGRRPHGSISLELGFDTAPRLAATIQHIDEYQTQVISSLALGAQPDLITLEWEPAEPPEERRYKIEADRHVTAGVQIDFAGLLPAGMDDPRVPEELASRLRAAVDQVRREFPAVRYLGPFRDRPQRRYRLPATMPTTLGITGEHAAGMLASDVARRQGRLLRKVNEVLAEDLPGWRLDVAERAGLYAVMLTSSEDSTLTVNLADVGTGVAQVLPIFVQRAADILNPPKRPVLEIIEQPELHLHPAAHGQLAELYLSAARRGGVRFLVETHSETFLLRVRRRVAEGVVDPRILAIYFIEHERGSARARHINIDDAGNLDYWPPGIFSEDYAETRALASAQLSRAESDAR